MNSVNYHDMFRTGIIKYDQILRYKQGLDSQVLANACACKYKHPVLYPAKQPELSYDMGEIPDNCLCTIYAKPP